MLALTRTAPTLFIARVFSKSTEDAATASGGAGGGLGLPAEDDTGELLAYGGYLPEMPDASTARAKVKSIKGAAKKKKKKKRKSKAASSAPLERRGGGYSLPGEPTQRPFHDSRVIELFHPDRDAEVPVRAPAQLCPNVPRGVSQCGFCNGVRWSPQYVEQGDPSMYTPKMLQRRAELKTNPGLQDAIKRFSKLFRWGSGGTTMSKADYMASAFSAHKHRPGFSSLRPCSVADIPAAQCTPALSPRYYRMPRRLLPHDWQKRTGRSMRKGQKSSRMISFSTLSSLLWTIGLNLRTHPNTSRLSMPCACAASMLRLLNRPWNQVLRFLLQKELTE